MKKLAVVVFVVVFVLCGYFTAKNTLVEAQDNQNESVQTEEVSCERSLSE